MNDRGWWRGLNNSRRRCCGRSRRERLLRTGHWRRQLHGRDTADVDRHRIGSGRDGIEAFFRVVGHDPGMAARRRLLELVAGFHEADEFAIAARIDPVDAPAFGRSVAERQFDGAAGLRRFQAGLGAAIQRLSHAQRYGRQRCCGDDQCGKNGFRKRTRQRQ
ncbi:hypothetical protein ACQ86E_24990 [Bradyrhizobium betae]|uniref:hypothetical protein n=1 Tax=Bradyrhizobium betae TaxID=244734 RepID=UPI003D669F7D